MDFYIPFYGFGIEGNADGLLRYFFAPYRPGVSVSINPVDD